MLTRGEWGTWGCLWSSAMEAVTWGRGEMVADSLSYIRGVLPALEGAWLRSGWAGAQMG